MRAIRPKQPRQKPDLFSVMLRAVAVGMAVTLTYQISVYHGDQMRPIARQALSLASDVGG